MNPISSSSLAQQAAQLLRAQPGAAPRAATAFGGANLGRNLPWQTPTAGTVALLHTLPRELAGLTPQEIIAGAFAEWQSSGNMAPRVA